MKGSHKTQRSKSTYHPCKHSAKPNSPPYLRNQECNDLNEHSVQRHAFVFQFLSYDCDYYYYYLHCPEIASQYQHTNYHHCPHLEFQYDRLCCDNILFCVRVTVNVIESVIESSTYHTQADRLTYFFPKMFVQYEYDR